MDEQEKNKLLADLHSGRETIVTTLSGVTEEGAVWIPAPGKWSIHECVEHLAVSEDYLFAQISAAQHSDTPSIPKQREALIVARASDRTRPLQSPEVGLPTGRFSTLSDALTHFLESRARTIGFVEDCVQDLRSELTSHPMIGVVNCYEILLLIAVHPHRHAKQIEEIMGSLNPCMNGSKDRFDMQRS
jgi:hypothetical protein